MKFFDNIPTISAEEQWRFSCWLYSSIFIISILMIAMISTTLRQYVTLKSNILITKPTISSNQLGEQRSKLLQEQQILEKKIAEYYAQPATYLAIITEILPPQVLLTSYGFESNKKISLQGKAQTDAALHHFIHMLEQWMTGKRIVIEHINKEAQELNFSLTIPW